jgi:DNA-binding LytR/AlgR family response regulator
MHILIADDEVPARGELRYILELLVSDATLYEAENGEKALELVEREPIEVVFLDINMPGLDGLAVAAMMMEDPVPPLIVFATAYDEHALQAFELAALDYVVKPFDERRLAQTVERVRLALDERAILAERRASMREYLSKAVSPAGLTKLWGERENENRVLVDYAQVMWIVAEDKRVYMHTDTGDKLLVRHTLKELEPRLVLHNFARVHRGYLVNLDHVSEVVPWFSGTYIVRMSDQTRTEIPMSRRYAARLKERTGW